MYIIHESEVESKLHEGYGYICFMGGCSGEPTIYAVGNRFIVFTKEEVENKIPEYIEVVKEQNKEGEDYYESIKSNL
jgi:hypothetical protein